MTNTQYIEAARDQYHRDGEIEIDDHAVVSRGDDPDAYVAAWVWVSNDTVGDDEPEASADEEAADTPPVAPSTPELLDALRSVLAWPSFPSMWQEKARALIARADAVTTGEKQ